jgi:crotonobetainyl-CoA:carnitine CoA-transferase CaiB-like acyl-CoA transferase
MLAGLGAEVLRVDPPWWDEPTLAAEMTLGKRCTRLDLRNPSERERWVALLSQADILVHGYRSDALAAMGLDANQRQNIRPGLIDISLDAYGFTGPWKHRRGFDSLVQMSMGIAHAGQQLAGSAKPKPLPVQALDHATGYILASAALRGLELRLRNKTGSIARASLARTGALLMTTLSHPQKSNQALSPETEADQADAIENTYWGAARRLRWPIEVSGVDPRWEQAAGPLGSSEATWLK